MMFPNYKYDTNSGNQSRLSVGEEEKPIRQQKSLNLMTQLDQPYDYDGVSPTSDNRLNISEVVVGKNPR